MPLLSIVVPVYNTKKYINQCLDSIVNQYNGEFELIIVDDGSTDECPLICDIYADKYDFIRVIHKENGGLLMARRTGIKEAQGDYIAHVDSDDYLLDGAIKTICDGIKESCCDMLFFDYIYGADSVKPERVIRVREENKNTAYQDKDAIFEQFLLKGNLNAMWMKVTKRAKVDCDTDYSEYRSVANGEDVLQSFALIDRSSSFLYIPKPLYYYRRDNVSMSKVYATKDYYSFRMVNEVMLKYAQKWNFSKEQLQRVYWDILSKNMVILHQVKKNEPEKFNELLKIMSKDAYFLNLKEALNYEKISSYYKILYRLISKGMISSAKMFIGCVALLKKR